MVLRRLMLYGGRRFISAISVTNGGTGYANNDLITIPAGIGRDRNGAPGGKLRENVQDSLLTSITSNIVDGIAASGGAGATLLRDSDSSGSVLSSLIGAANFRFFL